MPRDVTIHLFFAFDVGDEVRLEQARGLLPARLGQLERRPRTPESIRYRPAPLRMPLTASGVVLPGTNPTEPTAAELTIFDFGGVSLRTRHRLTLEDDELLQLAGRLALEQDLIVAARAALMPWLERLRPAVVDPQPLDLAEEYVVIQPHEARSDWLEDRPEWVAGLVRLEPSPLSASEVREATRLHLSYAPNDLVVVDWAAAFLSDAECGDTLQAIEFANVQLLQYRLLDDRLDDHLDRAYKLIRPGTSRVRSLVPRWRQQGFAARQVRELEIDVASLFERADNSLKLIGDQYLARVYALASTRFHLGDWQQSIRRKLDAIGDVYDTLVERAGSFRAEFMELVIILLILGEIILSLVRH